MGILMNPFNSDYGREAPIIIKYKQEGTVVQEVEQLLGKRDAILAESKMQLWREPNATKMQADKKKEVHYEVGNAMKMQADKKNSVFEGSVLQI